MDSLAVWNTYVIVSVVVIAALIVGAVLWARARKKRPQ
jgi:hypothetical protein